MGKNVLMCVHVIILLLLSVSASGGFPLLPQQEKSGCSCIQEELSEISPGVIWRGDNPALDLEEIIGLVAPALWFSEDEPLIRQGEWPFPHPHPCDEVEADGPVVYFQVNEILLRSREKVTLPPEEDPQFFEKVSSFTVRFYFYYRKDIGLSSHAHDIEVAEFEIHLDRFISLDTNEYCYQVRVASVTGYAHGVDWYYNTLHIEPDTRFPLTLFVEEGKHASCPDRNADGIYTPGYDVNERVTDAWGVRDVLSTGFLLGSSYYTSMTKPRKPFFKVRPPDMDLPCVHPWYHSLDRDTVEVVHTYELRRANEISVCEDIPPERKHLLHMMSDHRFGSEYQPSQDQLKFLAQLQSSIPATRRLIAGVGFRSDRGPGVGISFRAYDLGIGYLVPRINWTIGRDIALEGMITSSASRFFDWYASAGAGYESERQLNENGDLKVLDEREVNLVSEIGVKFRFRVSGKYKVFVLGYGFAGVRFGIRNSGFRNISYNRIIVEVGPGAW